MNIKLIGETSIVMSNPTGKADYFGWPSIARLQNGRLAVVASGYRYSHICPYGKLVIAYSENEGESYTSPSILIDTPLDDRDGGIAAFGERGVIVTSFNNKVEFQRKINQSRQNAAEKAMIDSYLDTVTPEDEERYLGSEFCISNDCGITFGEIHISPITSPHGPTELSDGSIIWVGRVFSSCDRFMEDADEIRAYRVNIDGSMEKLGVVPPVIIGGKRVLSCEPHMIELPSGKLLCHFRVDAQAVEGRRIFTTFQTESKDGGRSWSEPRQILGDVGGAPAHILRHSSGVLISAYGYRVDPCGIRVMFSHDDGETWDTDHILYKSPLESGDRADLGYPCTVELSDKSLATVFYAHTGDGEPAVIMQQKWSIED